MDTVRRGFAAVPFGPRADQWLLFFLHQGIGLTLNRVFAT